MGEQTPLLPSHYEEDEEFTLSKRAKILLGTLGAIFCAASLWLLCVFLPSHFIPEATTLEGIPRLAQLKVQLEPLTSQRVSELGLGLSSVVADSVQVEEEDDFEDIEVSDETTIESSAPKVERLILIGDIHGNYLEFKALLKKLNYKPKRDHILVLGDFITKGPDSLKVLDYLIEHDIDCIMGNHEFYVLNYYARFHGLNAPFFATDNSTTAEPQLPFRNSDTTTNGAFNDDPEFLLAKKLVPDQVKYINRCSIIKTLGRVPLHKTKNNGTAKYTSGVAVHAGLRWDIALTEQDPLDNLEMRSYLEPFYNETTSDPLEDRAVSWSKIFNQKQKEKNEEDTHVVYYGHDARRSLNLKKFTKGLDTGCDKGEFLTAMVIWNEIGQDKKGRKQVLYKEEPVQVKC